jgi:hypothetical protein
MVDKVPPPKKNKFSVDFSRALFSALDFLTFEVGANKIFRNIGNKIPLFCVISHKSADLT